MKYPKFAKIAGVKYPISTSYLTALKCFDIVNDSSISDSERSLAIMFKLFGFIPETNLDKFLDVTVRYLQRGETREQQSTKKKDMNFNEDIGYIVASFQSDYNIDLTDTDMHFYKFLDLIQGLTEKSVMSRVRDIRNYDLSEIKDPKFRAQMAEAQENLRLPEKISEDDQEALDEFEALFL